MKTYVTRPGIEIKAEEWDGTHRHAMEMGLKMRMDPITFANDYGIETLEGFMSASSGDFIVEGTEGERYPCKPEPFHKKYIIKED